LLAADFFGLSAAALGYFDAIYDRAAFVAVAPERRGEYVAKLRELAQPGAALLLVNFVHDMPGGPPFSIPEPELRRWFGTSFELEPRQEEDILSEEPHFRERGATLFREQIWLGLRR
jgi:thiopurine S-methyltransferase